MGLVWERRSGRETRGGGKRSCAGVLQALCGAIGEGPRSDARPGCPWVFPPEGRQRGLEARPLPLPLLVSPLLLARPLGRPRTSQAAFVVGRGGPRRFFSRRCEHRLSRRDHECTHILRFYRCSFPTLF